MKIFSTLTRRLAVLTTVLIIVSAVLILMNGCGPSDRERQLLDLETTLEENPDSVLEILDKNPKLAQGEKEQHLYNLLHAFARYKIAEDDTTIQTLSNLTQAAKYFENNNDYLHSSISYYLLGTGQLMKNDSFQAIISALKGVDRAKKADDHHWLAMNYRELADNFESIFDCGSSLHYHKCAAKEYRIAGDSLYYYHSLFDIARSFHAHENLDSALSYVREVHRIGIEQNIPILERNALGLIAVLEFQTGNPIQADKTFNLLRTKFPEYKEPSIIQTWGLNYLYLNKTAEAEKCLAELEELNGEASDLMWQLERNKGNKDKALELSRELFISQNKYIANIWNRTYSNTIEDYYQLTERQSQEKLYHQKISKIFTIICATLILSLAIVIFRYRIKSLKEKHNKTISLMRELVKIQEKYKKRYELQIKINTIISDQHNKLQQKYDNLNKEYDALNKNSKNHFSKIDHLIYNKLNVFRECCEEYYKFGPQEKVKNVWYNRILGKIDSFRYDSNFLIELESMTDKANGNVMERFQKDFPNLNPWEYTLFLFLKLDFTLEMICVLQEIEITKLYNRKSSLKRKILKSDSPYKGEFLLVVT